MLSFITNLFRPRTVEHVTGRLTRQVDALNRVAAHQSDRASRHYSTAHDYRDLAATHAAKADDAVSHADRAQRVAANLSTLLA